MFERYYSVERIDYLPSLLILVKYKKIMLTCTLYWRINVPTRPPHTALCSKPLSPSSGNFKA